MLRKGVLLLSILLFSVFAGYNQNRYCWQWSKGIGNGIPGTTRLISVNNSFIYTSGEFADTDISIGNALYMNKGGTDIVVVKRDNKGNIIWLRTIGGPSYDGLIAMCVDEQGAVYIGGSFSGYIQADTLTLPAKWGSDIFIAKYTTGGKLEWIKIIGPAGALNLSNLVKDGQQLRLSGTLMGTVSLGQFTLTDTAGTTFSASLHGADATVLYAKNFNIPASKYEKVDKKGNIYCAGISSSPVTIGNITIRPTCRALSYAPNPTSYNSFLWCAKFDSTGKLLWAKDLLSCDTFQALAYYREYLDFYVDESGFIYLSFIEGRWPVMYGPSPGDPYSNAVSVLSSDGELIQYGEKTTYGFLGTVVVRRYFLHAINKKVLLNNTTYNQMEYVPTISAQDLNENRLIDNQTSFYMAFIDTGYNAFYFTRYTHLSKLGMGMDVNAGPDRTICASDTLPVVLGDSITAACDMLLTTYKWTPSTGLSSDTAARPTVQLDQLNQEQEYYLTVNYGGAVIIDTVKIIKRADPARPVINAANNVMIVAAPVNASYQWYHHDSLLRGVNSNSLPVSRDGTYQVKITDTNFCSSLSDTFYAYKITINAGNDTAICNGNTVQLGAAPTGYAAAGNLTYEWTPSLYLNGAGSANPVAAPDNDICYKLVISNSYGNNAVDSVCIRTLPVPKPVISQQGEVLHSGHATGNKWFFNGQPIVNATGESLAFQDEGEYTVQVTDSNGCSALSPVYYATHSLFRVAVYSPVASAEMSIQYNLPKSGNITIEVFNIGNGTRKVIVSNAYQTAGPHVKNVSNTGYSKGIYLVRISTSYGNTTRKFLIQ